MKDGKIAEFQALKEEINHCQNRQHQILGFTLTALAILFGFSARAAHLLLFVPAFALALQLLYVREQDQIKTLGDYIRDQIEPFVPGMGWEHHVRQHPRPRRSRLENFILTIAVSAFFLVVNVLACLLYVVLAIPTQTFTRSMLSLVLLAFYVVGGLLVFRIWLKALHEFD